MSICNMSIEAGARAGMIAPDETTYGIPALASSYLYRMTFSSFARIPEGQTPSAKG